MESPCVFWLALLPWPHSHPPFCDPFPSPFWDSTGFHAIFFIFILFSWFDVSVCLWLLRRDVKGTPWNLSSLGFCSAIPQASSCANVFVSSKIHKICNTQPRSRVGVWQLLWHDFWFEKIHFWSQMQIQQLFCAAFPNNNQTDWIRYACREFLGLAYGYSSIHLRIIIALKPNSPQEELTPHNPKVTCKDTSIKM